MNGCSPTPERSPPANGESRDWFYRLGDRERGPMTLSQLTDLVASSGEVANEIAVRRGTAGEWVPYESVDSATALRLHSGRPDSCVSRDRCAWNRQFSRNGCAFWIAQASLKAEPRPTSTH